MNLEQCIQRMLKFPDIFKLCKQNNSEVSTYFRKNFDCKYLPENFLLFISIFDGLKLDDFNIFSIESKDKPFVVQTFADFSKDKDIEDYQNKLDMKSNTPLFFFATDNKGGRYAFKKQERYQKIYYMPSESPRKVVIYQDFADLLSEKIELAIKNVL